jgi:hypothetical protein
VTADTPGKIICVIATAALLLVIGYYAGHLKTRPNSIDDALESAHCYIYQQVYNNGNLTQTDMNIYSSYALKLANMQRLLLETNDFEWIKQYNIEMNKPLQYEGGSLAPTEYGMRGYNLQLKRIQHLKDQRK